MDTLETQKYRKGEDQMANILGTGQYTITDLHDAIISGTAPSNPKVGTLWIDTSVTPNILKSWNGSTWVNQSLDLSGIDPDAAEDLSNATITLNSLSADNIITKIERSYIKDKVTNIIGTILSDTASMPNLTTVDTNGSGEAGSVRRESITAGLATTHASYIAVGTEYTNLSNYLNALSPKPWDTTSNLDITVVSSEWRDKWLKYYEAVYALRTAISDKLKQTAENAGEDTVQTTKQYNGVQITPEAGLEAIRTDKKVKATLNATEGIKIERSTDGGTSWTKKFYADTNGVLYANGLVISSDSKIGGENASTVVSNASKAIDAQSTATAAQNTANATNQQLDKDQGINKWLFKRYNVTTPAGHIPTYDTVKSIQPSDRQLINDGALLVSGIGDNYIGHLKTAVYVNTAKNISFNFTHDDGANIYLNGVSVYSKGATTANVLTTLPLKAGWNTIEYFWSEHTGGDGIYNISAPMNTLVDKMSCYSSDDEGRFLNAETVITDAKAKVDAVTTTENNTTVIEGGKIRTNSVTANKINVKGLTVNNGTKNTFVVDTNGNVTIDGTVFINSSTQFADGYDPTKITTGVRNVLMNSRFATSDTTSWSNWNSPTVRIVETITDLPGFDKAVKFTTSSSNQGLLQNVPAIIGNKYTVSAWVKSESGRPVLQVYDGLGYPAKPMETADVGTNKWVKLSLTFTANASTIQVQIGRGGGGSNGTYWFTGIKVEEGTLVSGWTPSAEDIENNIDTVSDQVSLVVDPTNQTIRAEEIASAISVEPYAINVISENINLKGKVTFSSFTSWIYDADGAIVTNADQPDYDPNNPLYLSSSGEYLPLDSDESFFNSLFTKEDGRTRIEGSLIKTGTIMAKDANFRGLAVYGDLLDDAGNMIGSYPALTIDDNGNLSMTGTAQSRDFETGKTGWQIKQDGTAEFNASTFRGNIELGYYDAEDDVFVVTGGLLSGNTPEGKDLRFWAGTNRDNAPFKVFSDGSLEANKGTFNGTFSGEVQVGNILIVDNPNVEGDASITIKDNAGLMNKIVLNEQQVDINTVATFGSDEGTFLTIDGSQQVLEFGAKDFKIDYANNLIQMKNFSVQGSDSLDFVSDGASGEDFVFKSKNGTASMNVEGNMKVRDGIELTDTLTIKKSLEAGNKGIDFVFI